MFAIVWRRHENRIGRRLWAVFAGGVLVAACSTGQPRGAARAGAPPTETAVHSLGDKVVLQEGHTAQVFSYSSNAEPSNDFSKPQPGMVFAAIDVEGCAGPAGSSTGVLNPFFFTLLLADNQKVQTSIPVKEPGLNVGPQAPGSCTRGFVTYEIPSSVKATAVVLDLPGRRVRWTVP